MWHLVRLVHSIIDFRLELGQDVSPTAQFPEQIRKSGRGRIGPRNSSNIVSSVSMDADF